MMKMMCDLKNILVVGSSGYVGAVLVRKLLRAGHKIKTPGNFIYRRDIFLGPTDIDTACNVNLTDIEDDFRDKNKHKRIISGCNVVIYLAQSFGEHDDGSDYDVFISIVDMAKSYSVERFIYVSDYSERDAPFLEYLSRAVSESFSVIIINASEAFSLFSKQKLRLPVDIFTKGMISKHEITLYGRKQKSTIPPRELPDTWYTNRNVGVLGFHVAGMAGLCLYISEQPLEEIQEKIWPHVTTCKLFLNHFYITRKFLQIWRKPYIPCGGSFKFFFCTIQRLFDVSLMMFLVHLWPGQAYRFSTRRCLPSQAMRLRKSNGPIVPFELVESRTNDIPKMKEVNIVLRGSSFDIKQLEKLNSPIFLGSFWEPIETKKDVVYMTGGAKNALRFAKLGLKVIYFEVNVKDDNGNISPKDSDYTGRQYEKFIDGDTCGRIAILDKVHCLSKFSSPLWFPTGSALPAICALSYFAEKINIYGWDFYLESSPRDMSYWQLYFNLYNFKIDILESSRNFFESAMINFYYGYHFSKLPNMNICGRLGQLDKHEKLIGKIERVLFND